MNVYQQFALNFPNQVSYEADTFVISKCNAQAYHWVMSQQLWGSYGLLLTGDEGCGKTHLAHIWQAVQSARFINASDLNCDDGQLIQQNTAFIIEDIDRLTHLQTELFHFLNQVRENQHSVLLTLTGGLSADRFTLKDLMTRLKSLPTAAINSPDDTVAEAIMVKCFADMQLPVDNRIISYLLTRTERSYHNIHSVIRNIYQLSLTCHQKITLPLVKTIL